MPQPLKDQYVSKYTPVLPGLSTALRGADCGFNRLARHARREIGLGTWVKPVYNQAGWIKSTKIFMAAQ
jgi:hypothetical protein